MAEWSPTEVLDLVTATVLLAVVLCALAFTVGRLPPSERLRRLSPLSQRLLLAFLAIGALHTALRLAAGAVASHLLEGLRSAIGA